MTEQYQCTKILRISDGKDAQGRPLHHNERCVIFCVDCAVALNRLLERE